jgi:inosine/xanthosine triphosphatase
MMEKYPATKYEIIEINEVFNKPITQEIDSDILVVSEGRSQVAEETNEHRKKHGKPPLEIVAVPYVLAQDGLPIKATRIAEGEIDSDGKLLGTVRVFVGTNNDVKLQAVKNVFEKIFEKVELEKVPVSSNVPAQPYEKDTITGAMNRAKGALQQASDAHFGIGIEAGLFLDENTKNYFDVQYCAVLDRGGRITLGHGSGFYYPPKVVEGLLKGKSVGEVMAVVTGIQDIGHKQGAIGYLSKNILDRGGLTEQAVLMAMVPRLGELYE